MNEEEIFHEALARNLREERLCITSLGVSL